ncbi:Crotonobetainyl-CoA:carnitine CoA-transferase CaiB [Paracoccus solventivorans]|uniref:Crotonobetainyl-CoA:carnitine CoA-transferase CaiB n=1 Tax=Paracoccus solventivorans TaxID=53463 RepID=A0A1M7ERV3_9RHOB|nr:CoA transferase [Paracoccus solventivorans]SHL94358.1 Crotonobetainyl-CoA:carnitine CoA-transferase CaiB [Paracoccus solventivorans]
MGPLAGLRIIDMSSVLMGPYSTQLLGDFGADVIKVESPDGDLVRQIGPARNSGMGPLFLNANRSKRSITLNLKRPECRDALLRLCRDADVLVYNVRPKAMARLGLSHEDVAAVNPRIIYAGMFGYSQDGPYADRPAYDDLIQGASTLPYLFSRVNEGQPRYVPSAVADRVVGLVAASAILASVVERDKSGCGQRVDVPMFETMVSFVLGDHLGGLTFQPPLDNGGYARQLSADRRPYQTLDGHICALIYNDGHWQRFFAAIGRPEMPQADPRYRSFVSRMAHINEVYGELAEIFLTRTTAEWMDLLEKADVPAMPMYDFQGVLNDPHLVATGFFQTVEHPSEGSIRQMGVPAQWSRTPAVPSRLAPRQGEQGAEILREAGFTEDEIADLTATAPAEQAPSTAIEI